MPTYASSSEGLFLQSVTEQKHPGGLFTVSAEYRRISGNTSLPATIPSSEGDITVYPEPTITIGTDGFEKVNATGYAIWSTEIAKKMSMEVGQLRINVRDWVLDPDPPDPPPDPPVYVPDYYVLYEDGFLFESSHQSQMRENGSDVIPAAPTLRVLNFAGEETTEYSNPMGLPQEILKTATLKNIVITNFGEVEQVEVVHAIISADVSRMIDYPNG
jgi:hypothetical protein